MKYTDDFLLSELRRYYNEYNKVPSYDDLKYKHKNYPTVKPYMTRFGSWNEALNKADLQSHEAKLCENRLVNHCKECGEVIKTTKAVMQVFCSKSCAVTFNNKRRAKPEEYFASKRQYRELAKFRFNPLDFPQDFDIEQIETIGFMSSTNKFGLVKDHIFSVHQGFKDRVDPKLLAHPANCSIILQPDNARKSSRCGMTLEELLEKIRIWDEAHK